MNPVTVIVAPADVMIIMGTSQSDASQKAPRTRYQVWSGLLSGLIKLLGPQVQKRNPNRPKVKSRTPSETSPDASTFFAFMLGRYRSRFSVTSGQDPNRVKLQLRTIEDLLGFVTHGPHRGTQEVGSRAMPVFHCLLSRWLAAHRLSARLGNRCALLHILL